MRDRDIIRDIERNEEGVSERHRDIIRDIDIERNEERVSER